MTSAAEWDELELEVAVLAALPALSAGLRYEDANGDAVWEFAELVARGCSLADARTVLASAGAGGGGRDGALEEALALAGSQELDAGARALLASWMGEP